MSSVIIDPESVRALPAAEPSHYRGDIQGLRAIAVILVVLDHAGVPGFQGGYVGVDVFFVISGYVITSLLVRQPPRHLAANLGTFYARRIRRIVPAATVVLVATVLVAYVTLGANFNPQLLGDVRWASLFAANFRLIATGSNYFIPGVAPSLITHFWSLAVEEQFYLVYPLVVFLSTRSNLERRRRTSLALILVLGVAVSAWWSWHLTPLAPVEAYYSPFTRFWELGLGGLATLVPAYWTRRAPRLNAVLAVLALVALGDGVLRLNATSAYPGTLAWIPCGAAALLLVTGVVPARAGPATWLAWRPLRYVGDISYSLYLYHYAWLMLPLLWTTPTTSAAARALEVAGALICSILSYHLIENPIRRSSRLSRDRLAALLVLLVCVAASWNATLLVARLAHLAPYALSH
ncbi:MAG: acyltransferase [Acidobacteriota bacterium]|nr:acyltransferase [Acidobacteriota bacterium]